MIAPQIFGITDRCLPMEALFVVEMLVTYQRLAEQKSGEKEAKKDERKTVVTKEPRQ